MVSPPRPAACEVWLSVSCGAPAIRQAREAKREREGGDGHTCPSRSVRMLPAPTRSLNLASSCDERHSCEMTSSHARPVGEQVAWMEV